MNLIYRSVRSWYTSKGVNDGVQDGLLGFQCQSFTLRMKSKKSGKEGGGKERDDPESVFFILVIKKKKPCW